MSGMQQIERAEEVVANATKSLKEIIEKVQRECPHPPEDLLEGRYQIGSLVLSTQPPFRVCTRCGYAEEGWGCGYEVLRTKTDVPEIDRKTVSQFIKGGLHMQTRSYDD